MSLCTSIPYDYGLETLRKRVNDLQRQRYLLRTYCKWRNMFLKIFFFEFYGEVKQQKSGTAICTKFKPPFACIFMDEIETESFKSEELQPFLWLSYINGIFLIWTHGKQNLDSFHNELYNFHPNLSFKCETSTEIVNFVDLNVRIKNGPIYYRPLC